ncbi:hypothetical protein GCM10027406_28810 [Leifsonia lichenia]
MSELSDLSELSDRSTRFRARSDALTGYLASFMLFLFAAALALAATRPQFATDTGLSRLGVGLVFAGALCAAALGVAGAVVIHRWTRLPR